MVIALERQATEVEMGRHAARLRAGFDHRHLMTRLGGMIGGREAHGPRTDDGDTHD